MEKNKNKFNSAKPRGKHDPPPKPSNPPNQNLPNPSPKKNLTKQSNPLMQRKMVETSNAYQIMVKMQDENDETRV